MFFRERQAGEKNIKTGFAFLPVCAKNGVVWLEHYELFRHWDIRHARWINEEVSILTTA